MSVFCDSMFYMYKSRNPLFMRQFMRQSVEVQPSLGVGWAMFEPCFVIVGAYAWIDNAKYQIEVT